MPYAKANRVFETTTTTGTGSLSLAGAITGFQTFVSGIGNGNTCHYEINNGTDWEIGIGTVTAGSPDVLSRDTVLESTNADAKVNWGSGTKNVFVCFPAQTTAETDADNTFSGDNDFSGANDFSGGTMTLPSATTALFATAAQGALADNLNSFFSGQVIYGLTMSNNATDATNDIDISIGGAVSSNGVQMSLASGLTKRLDAAWAAGTNQGGLDTGTISNATYHLWLIRKDSDGSLDVLFSLSSTTPTMPSGYSEKCLIGRIIRTGGAIALFKQIGRHVKLKEGISLYSKSSATLTNGETFSSLVSGVIGKCSVSMNTSSTSGTNYYSLADNIQPGATNAQYIAGGRNISGSNSIDAASFEIPMISGTMVFYCGSTSASTVDIYLNGWEEI